MLRLLKILVELAVTATDWPVEAVQTSPQCLSMAANHSSADSVLGKTTHCHRSIIVRFPKPRRAHPRWTGLHLSTWRQLLGRLCCGRQP